MTVIAQKSLSVLNFTKMISSWNSRLDAVFNTEKKLLLVYYTLTATESRWNDIRSHTMESTSELGDHNVCVCACVLVGGGELDIAQ